MGFIKAFTGAIGGSFADQWKEFLTVPAEIKDTVGICPAVRSLANGERNSNDKNNENIITNDSLIFVPEGFALITMENGAITGFVSEPGGYQWKSDDINSKSFLSGGGLIESVIKQSWERFKFAGVPGAMQMAFYLNLKEIPNNKFGTQGEIYWDDAYMNTQVGAIAHGTYSLKIADPILFLKEYVPVEYYSKGGKFFDFADYDNSAAEQLFNEVVGSLAGAISAYTNDANKQNRMANIQRDSVGFASTLAKTVEDNYAWAKDRGLQIVKAVLLSIEYDADTKELMSKVRQADALMGTRGNVNLQASFAEGIQAAGENPEGGALGMGFMGMGMEGAAGVMGGMMQQPAQENPASQSTQQTASTTEDPYEKLAKLKDLLDKGVITQEDFDSAKAKILDL